MNPTGTTESQSAARLEAIRVAIIDNAELTMIATDNEGLITFCNRAALSRLGYESHEMINQATPVLIHDPQEIVDRAAQLSVELGREIEPGFEVFFVKAIEHGVDEHHWTYICKDGSRFTVRLSVTALRAPDGQPLGFLGIGQDITEILKTKRDLHESESRFQAFMEHTPAMAFIKDAAGRYLFVNQPFLKNFGKTDEETIGKRDHEIWPVGIADTLRANDLKVLSNGVPIKIEETIPTADGKSDTWLSIKFPLETAGNERCLAGLAVDISERKYYEQQIIQSQSQLEDTIKELERVVTQDSLTGLKNRRAFDSRLEGEISRARRYRLPLSLLMLDVDHFKSFNDTFGHPAGDEALRQVAKLLNEHSRPGDMVARYGGEEFVILQTNTRLRGALISADRIRQLIEDSVWDKRSVTVSIGAAELSEKHETGVDLVSDADRALYKAKTQGRNCVCS